MSEKYQVSKDILDQMKNLTDRIVTLERANNLTNTTIDVQSMVGEARGMQVIDKTTGKRIAFIGLDPNTKTPDGLPQPFVRFMRANDGSTAFEVFDTDPTDGSWAQVVALYDSNGHRIVADDANSGFGLAVPQLDHPMYRIDDFFSTASGAFVVAWYTTFVNVQPRLYAGFYVDGPGGANGDAQIRINGAVYPNGDDQTIPFDGSTGTISWFLDPTSEGYGNWLNFEIWVRKLGGTGNVTVRPWLMRGQGS